MRKSKKRNIFMHTYIPSIGFNLNTISIFTGYSLYLCDSAYVECFWMVLLSRCALRDSLTNCCSLLAIAKYINWRWSVWSVQRCQQLLSLLIPLFCSSSFFVVRFAIGFYRVRFIFMNSFGWATMITTMTTTTTVKYHAKLYYQR